MLHRRNPPCGHAGLWDHYPADRELTDLVSRVTQDDLGTVYSVQLAVYPTTEVAARWVAQFAHFGSGCVKVLLPGGLAFGGERRVTGEEGSDLDPQPGALNRLGVEQAWAASTAFGSDAESP